MYLQDVLAGTSVRLSAGLKANKNVIEVTI